jgi:KUP system potassium uptake protein
VLVHVHAGVGLYYGEDIHGVPPVLLQFVSRTPVLYEVNIFVTNRFVPIPEVLPSERILVEQLGVSGFYHIVAR